MLYGSSRWSILVTFIGSFLAVVDEICIQHVPFIYGLVVFVCLFILNIILLLDQRVLDWFVSAYHRLTSCV